MLFNKNTFLLLYGFLLIITSASFCGSNGDKTGPAGMEGLKNAFKDPPDSAKPGVYWYFMDGNMSRQGMKKDIAAMKEAGIGQVLFLEVNVGVPRGSVDFLSKEWYDLFKYGVGEAKKSGIDVTLGIGPGWTGSGGPWVPPGESMQHLVAGDTMIPGPVKLSLRLPVPAPKKPYFGEGIFTPELKKEWQNFYKDVAVLAFPAPESHKKIGDIDEKALFYRAPYTSVVGVKTSLPSRADYPDYPLADIDSDKIVDLTDRLSADGTLHWDAPPGDWIIMRLVARNNGAITRPAPVPGLGFECDKLDTVALAHHMENYVGRILDTLGKLYTASPGGLKKLHMDSWEMGAQNWTAHFRQEFIKKRGYDPLPFYPVYAGFTVERPEISERFLWDLRQTCQELVFENHVGWLKRYAHRRGLKLSIEPYDMNPTADLELGALADIPMGEFWSKGFGFNAVFSCIEAASVAHVNGISLVQAEAFTADGNEAWKQFPGSMKNQGDWAFAMGINRFFYHTFAHKPWEDNLQPGMTMGPYGVHWDRKQTWWPMAGAYHRYIARCQFMLQQGMPVADILYLTPEGAPQVFVPPASALSGDSLLPDKKGFSFDGCSPGQLYDAAVEDHRIIFPGGAAYRLLVLPSAETMTPGLLEKIRSLVKAGAVVIGPPPRKSPGLSGYPSCDSLVKERAKEIWGGQNDPATVTTHPYGKGRVIWGGAFKPETNQEIYPAYPPVARLLHQMKIYEDFTSDQAIRYTHRQSPDGEIYFVSNTTPDNLTADCVFRTEKGRPELWDPLTGKTRPLPDFSVTGGRTTVPLAFAPHQSFFIVFPGGRKEKPEKGSNFSGRERVQEIPGPWTVSFDTARGGPGEITLDRLIDWSSSGEEGIKYYSGIAVYQTTFDLPAGIDPARDKLYLDLGTVRNLAHVWLNGRDLGVVWTDPWEVSISEAVRPGKNQLKIAVANLWPNRLIGDARFPEKSIQDGHFRDWLTRGEKKPPGRYSFTTYPYYKPDDKLLESGLIGPVTIKKEGVNASF